MLLSEFFVGRAEDESDTNNDKDADEGSSPHEQQVKAASDAHTESNVTAVGAGLKLDNIDAAMESKDPKSALVEMLLAAQR